MKYSPKKQATSERLIAAMSSASSKKARLEALFPMLKRELLDGLKQQRELPAEALEWLDNAMQYTVPGGKLNRGTAVVDVYEAMVGSANVSDTDIARASVLGWAVEFLQAFFLVADDVMDASLTRRGQPCWYKRSEVGMIAINDSFLLESFVFQLLKTHFGDEPALYHKLVDLFLTTIQQTECGQLLDLTSQPMDTSIVDLSRFTWDRYRRIVQYKTAYYTFYLSFALGMVLSGVEYTASMFGKVQQICLQMGEYFQIQDDYLDCFGDPAVIGKVGTDIQDNKCSWLVVQALGKADAGQKKVLESNYGQWDDAKVERVKSLYRELDLPALFAKYEEESYGKIQAEITSIKDARLPRAAFDLMLGKIYKRSK